MKILMIQMLVHGIATKNPNFCVPKTVLSLFACVGGCYDDFHNLRDFQAEGRAPSSSQKKTSFHLHSCLDPGL